MLHAHVQVSGEGLAAGLAWAFLQTMLTRCSDPQSFFLNVFFFFFRPAPVAYGGS